MLISDHRVLLLTFSKKGLQNSANLIEPVGTREVLAQEARLGHNREVAMRLGEFERWILLSCYKKTIQHDLPEDWRRPRGHRRIEAADGFHDEYLFKSEILLNWFGGLKLSEKQSFLDDVIEKFKTTKAYRKALVTYRRSVNQLEGKGLIREFVGGDSPRWTGIRLTEAGILKAIELDLHKY